MINRPVICHSSETCPHPIDINSNCSARILGMLHVAAILFMCLLDNYFFHLFHGYMGKTLTDQNCIHEEIKSRLNSGNACYIRFSLLSCRLLSRNVKVKIYKSIILSIVLYGCEIWSLMLREGHRLRVFENMVLRRIFGPKMDEVTGEWRKLHNKKLQPSSSCATELVN
jgi:hypothetical protein